MTTMNHNHHQAHHHHAEDHDDHTLERHCDVAIVGGSAAGLAAALQLGRQRRSVIVVDAGAPRNAPADHMHSYLGHEGRSPSEFASIGREEVRSYGVEVVPGTAADVDRSDEGGFRVELAGGNTIVARRLLIATGLVDELPAIDGLAEHWGGDVIHCPFCHGYEVRDARIVQIVSHPMGLHPSALFRQLTENLTVVLHEGVAADAPEVEALRTVGVRVVDEPVRRVVTGDDGHVSAVELFDGTSIEADVIAIGPRFRVRTEPFASIGVIPKGHPSGLGDFIETDQTGATDVAGVFAAGNVTDSGQQVLHAAAHGSRVGAFISWTLADEDLRLPNALSGNATDWERRYSGDWMWSGDPNPSLVTEISGMQVGTALDVGAGEGGDAVWLAKQGWEVTASDISQRALDRLTEVVDQRGLSIDTLCADANASDAFGDHTFDLVTAHYASIPRTRDGRAVSNLMRAVGPWGTLLVVGHDLEPMRDAIDVRVQSRPFDPDAYVRVSDFVDVLEASSGWEVEIHETRPRPAKPGARQHHVADEILRARRIEG